MIPNKTYELKNLYFQNSPYSIEKPQDPSYDSLLQWPAMGYFDRLRPDFALLKEALASYSSRGIPTVAEQVFGNQTRQQKISLKHLVNILYERAILHKSHLKDIDRRLMDCQERLSIIKMHFPVDGGRSQQNLEKLIIDLEKQRHDEELNFWKDTTEVREKLFEQANVYSATKHRKDMLYGVEDKHA
jgi:hypothetical protein